jgi:mandelate racemase
VTRAAARGGGEGPSPALTMRALRTRAVDLPMARPTQTAAGAITSTPLALIDLDAGDVTGTAYVFCYSKPGLAAVVAALDEIGPTLAGAKLDGLWEALRRRFRLLGTSGVIGLALNGIDMAVWDARARAAGRPLTELLGGRAGAKVTAYGSLKSARPADLAEEVGERRPAGFRAFKLKIGGGSPDDDLAAIDAVREASGGARLMVDYNQSLTLDEALVRLRRLDAEGLEWIEEPLPADDLDGYVRLCEAIETPIQAGESWWSPEEAERHIAARACDLAMPDVARVGGVTGWLRAAAAAAAAGIGVSTHNYPEVGAHLLAAVPNAHLLEHLDKTSPLVEPLEIVDGQITVSSEPGSGVAFSA